MDSNGLMIGLILFGMALPFSLVCLAYLVVICGWLRDPDDQPLWFRFVLSRIVPNYGHRPPSVVAGIVAGMLPLAALNLYPVVLMAAAPLGSGASVLDLLYFLVLAILLFPVARAVARERSRGRAK
jgi:hypothetical protein